MSEDVETLPFITLKDASIQLPIKAGSRAGAVNKDRKASVGGEIVSSFFGGAINALNDVNLELKSGDRVALVGANGSGKTSLLRLLAGIYLPSQGVRESSGRISCLFSNTIGLSPMATGYENIELGCRLYGLNKAQIDAARDEIADFTELGEFLNLPLSNYSAGMRTRLGFAIVTALRPEILLVDEVMAAGDKVFAAKARARMFNLMGEAGILVLASHSKSILKNFCDEALLVHRSKLVMRGTVDDVLELHNEMSSKPAVRANG